MALGNGNPKEGDKGSNFFWELKVLQGLEAIAEAIEAGGGGGGGGGGITQLTGEVTAGPGAGSEVATITPLAVTTAKLGNNAVTNAKIANNAVTFSKMQLIPDYTFLGNSTFPAVGSGAVAALSLSNIPYFNAAIGGVPSNTTFLRGDGTWTAVPPGGITTLNTSGLISGGPITAPSGTVTTSMNTSRLVGRFSANAGEMQEILIGTGLQLNTGTGTLTATSTTLTQTLGTTVDGSGGTVTAGLKGYIKVPYACTITGWTVISTTATPLQAIQFDIWRRNGALPTSAAADSLIDTVAGGIKPQLSGGQQLRNSINLNFWSTSLAAGDYLAFRVDSATIVSWAILQINVTRV